MKKKNFSLSEALKGVPCYDDTAAAGRFEGVYMFTFNAHRLKAKHVFLFTEMKPSSFAPASQYALHCNNGGSFFHGLGSEACERTVFMEVKEEAVHLVTANDKDGVLISEIDQEEAIISMVARRWENDGYTNIKRHLITVEK